MWVPKIKDKKLHWIGQVYSYEYGTNVLSVMSKPAAA